jgi:hypothetical protein
VALAQVRAGKALLEDKVMTALATRRPGAAAVLVLIFLFAIDVRERLASLTTLLVNVGRQIVSGLLLGGLSGSTPGANHPTYLAWGTGTSGPAAGDTALGTAASEARTNGTASQQTTSTTNDTYQVVGTITCAGAGKTISEAGLFDASTAGNLFIHSVFTGLALNVGDGIQFTFQWQVA